MPEKSEEDVLEVVIDTPRESRIKYKYEPKEKAFKLSKILPAGAVFPYNFGFLPDTRGEDGDPLDVLVLTEVSALPGCVLPSRLIGVLEAEQTEEDGTKVRNDRFIAVAEADPAYENVSSYGDLSEALRKEITHFFVSYNAVSGRKFRPFGFRSADTARVLIEKAHKPIKGKKAA